MAGKDYSAEYRKNIKEIFAMVYEAGSSREIMGFGSWRFIMKIDDLRNLNKEDLTQKLSVLYDDLLKLNYQKRVGNLEKPHSFKSIHKDIARIKTVLKEKEA
jgi:large subunit ribosomal protein L29